MPNCTTTVQFLLHSSRYLLCYCSVNALLHGIEGKHTHSVAPQLSCCFYRLRSKELSCCKGKGCSSLQLLEEVLFILNCRVGLMSLSIFVFYTDVKIRLGNIRSVPKNTDNVQYIVQDGKLIFFQDGTPVRNRTVWVLQGIEVSVPHVVNKPNMCSTWSSLHYKRGSNCVPSTSLLGILKFRDSRNREKLKYSRKL